MAGKEQQQKAWRAAYAEKLKDPRWQRKRLEVFDLAGWACECCDSTDKTLHVHHKQYIKGREPWEYEPDQLSALCEDCHEQQHQAADRLIDVVSRLPIAGGWFIDREKAACLIAGVLGLEDFHLQNDVQKAWFEAGLGIQPEINEKLGRSLVRHGAETS